MAELFSKLSAQELLQNVTESAASGGQASDTLPLVQEFADSLDQTRRTIENRFVYYSRLATVGTIAQMLIHEIRNRTTTLGSMLRYVKGALGMFPEKSTLTRIQRASEAIDALDNLAYTFAPLANRNFTRRRQQLVLEDRIRACLQMNEADIREKEIKCVVPNTKTVSHSGSWRARHDSIELDTQRIVLAWGGFKRIKENRIRAGTGSHCKRSQSGRLY